MSPRIQLFLNRVVLYDSKALLAFVNRADLSYCLLVGAGHDSSIESATENLLEKIEHITGGKILNICKIFVKY